MPPRGVQVAGPTGAVRRGRPRRPGFPSRPTGHPPAHGPRLPGPPRTTLRPTGAPNPRSTGHPAGTVPRLVIRTKLHAGAGARRSHWHYRHQKPSFPYRRTLHHLTIMSHREVWFVGAAYCTGTARGVATPDRGVSNHLVTGRGSALEGAGPGFASAPGRRLRWE